MTVPAGVLREMCEPPEHLDSVLFYAFTLTADHDGRIFFDTQSIWAGYADADRKIELREARVVDLRMGEVWRSLGQPFVFVKQAEHLAVYLRTGGHALVLSSVAEGIVPDMLKPDATCQLGEAGFMAKTLVNDAAFKKAPTPKLRMEVLRRDRRRCRICGRNPDDDTDIVLNVHHIRPWAMRGLTALQNLITLCHTCHRGLDPHYDHSLYEYLRLTANDANQTFIAGVENGRVRQGGVISAVAVGHRQAALAVMCRG
jgi:hypothetical protein